MDNQENTDKMGVSISTENDHNEPLQNQVLYSILTK